MYWGGLCLLFLLVSSSLSQDTIFFPDPSDIKHEETTPVTTDTTSSTVVSPVEKCLEGDKCKPPAQCALYFTE
jgi:hypothetical protein